MSSLPNFLFNLLKEGLGEEMVNIKELFTYKKRVIVKNRDGEEAEVWVRLLGEEDLNAAYKSARVESLKKRELLKDSNTIEYQDQILPVKDLEKSELILMIVEARKSRITAEAFIKVNKEEILKIEDIAVEPDAPTLEEQETLDTRSAEQSKDYGDRVDEYIATRLLEEQSNVENSPIEELVKEAQTELIGILPLNEFFIELNAQKAYRGTYTTKQCIERVFSSVEEFHNFDSDFKAQITTAYTSLEIGADDVKN